MHSYPHYTICGEYTCTVCSHLCNLRIGRMKQFLLFVIAEMLLLMLSLTCLIFQLNILRFDPKSSQQGNSQLTRLANGDDVVQRNTVRWWPAFSDSFPFKTREVELRAGFALLRRDFNFLPTRQAERQRPLFHLVASGLCLAGSHNGDETVLCNCLGAWMLLWCVCGKKTAFVLKAAKFSLSIIYLAMLAFAWQLSFPDSQNTKVSDIISVTTPGTLEDSGKAK